MFNKVMVFTECCQVQCDFTTVSLGITYLFLTWAFKSFRYFTLRGQNVQIHKFQCLHFGRPYTAKRATCEIKHR